MDEYNCYVKLIKIILKHSDNEGFIDKMVPLFLKIVYNDYYNNRNSKKYNLDNLYKKYWSLVYKALKRNI